MDKKDLDVLNFLYEESCQNKTDYLVLENVENFDWEYFWNRYIFCEQVCFNLYESFERIKTSERSDVYKITTTTGLVFTGYVNYLTKEDIDNRLVNTIIGNLDDREEIKKIQDVLKTGKSILNVNFQDSEGNTKLTGNVGNYTFSVLSGIRNSIVDSIYNRNADISMMIVNIAKNEPRRLEIYQRFFKKCFPKFKNLYIDKNFSQDYNLIYIY